MITSREVFGGREVAGALKFAHAHVDVVRGAHAAHGGDAREQSPHRVFGRADVHVGVHQPRREIAAHEVNHLGPVCRPRSSIPRAPCIDRDDLTVMQGHCRVLQHSPLDHINDVGVDEHNVLRGNRCACEQREAER